MSLPAPYIRRNGNSHLEINPSLEFLPLAVRSAMPTAPGYYELEIDPALGALVLVNPDTGGRTIVSDLPSGEGPAVSAPEDGSNFYAGSLITPANIGLVAEAYRAPIGPHYNEEADDWVGVAVDEANVYLTAHARRWPTAGPTGPPFTYGDGLLACFARADGSAVWRRTISSYSKVAGDYSRARPFLYTAPNGVKLLYFGSSIQQPQVSDLAGGPTPLYDAFSGAPVRPTGRPMRAYCVRAADGVLVWEAELGNKAAAYGDEDNMASIAAPPVVVEIDRHNNGQLAPVVVFGASSFQSYYPFQTTTAPSTAFAPGFPGMIGNRQFRMTDQGKVFILDALDGEVLSTTRMGPPPMTAGAVLNNALPVSQGGGYRQGPSLMIRRDIQVTDFVPGQLAPVGAPFVGAQRVSWLLTNNFGAGPNVIPACLNGIAVTDPTNGAPVVLVGGAPITASLEGLVVGADIAGGFTLGAATFTPVGSVGGPFPIDAANLMPPGLEPARCWKYLTDGLVLDAADAYEASFHGCSVWGGTRFVVNRDGQGRAVELYVTTGQNHHAPAEYVEARLAASTPFPPSVVDGTPFPAGPEPTSHVLARNYARTAEQNFLSFPTAQNLANVRQIDDDWLRTIQSQQNVPGSARSALNAPCALVGIDLRGASLGDRLWAQSVAGFDCWHAGMIILPMRAASPTLLTTPANAPGQAFQFVSLYTDAQEYYGYSQATDGDLGAGCVLRKGLGPGGSDVVAAFSKSGNLFGVYLSDVSLGPSASARMPYAGGVNGLVVAGTSAYIGGVNYGLGAKGPTIFGIQANNQGGGFNNLTWQQGGRGSLVPAPQPFTPRVGWFPKTLTTPLNPLEYQLAQSYLAAYSVATGAPLYEALVEPEAVPPYIASTATVSVTDTLVWAPTASGVLSAFDLATGDLAGSFPLDAAGITSPTLSGKEVYVFNGRSLIAQSYPESGYARSKYLFKFSL